MAYQSKKHRKFVATSVTAALVATAVAPAAGFAAEFKDEVPAWAKDAVDFLIEKGAIEGYADGTFKPNQAIKRGEAAKILALALELEIDDEAKTEFEDAKDHWASKYIKAIQDQKPGVINGDNGKFRPNDTITRQEMAKMVVEAYGLELDETADVDFSDNTGWGKEYVNILASLGIVDGVGNGKFDPNGAVTRAQTPVFVYRTVVEDERLEVPKKPVTDPEVVSVSATNLKEIVVEFNTALDKTTVKTENFRVIGVTFGDAVLSENGKTVTLVLSGSTALTNQKEYTLTTSNIKSATGVTVDRTETKFTPFDGVLPTIEDVTVTGPKNLEIKFSEPIKTAGTVVLKSGNTTFSVKSPIAIDNTDTVNVELYADMKDGTEYVVNIKDFVDFADYKNIVKEFTFTYTKDTTAPVATIAEATQEYVKVEFNKPVKGLTKNNFSHSFTAWKPIEVFPTKEDMENGTNAITAGDSVKTVYVQFSKIGTTNYPLPAGATTLNILGKVGTVEVKDNYGNKLGDVSLEVTVEADKVAPTVTAVEATAKDAIKVTFSKAVHNAGNAANYEILDADGKKISGLLITPNVAADKKSVTLKLNKDFTGKTLNVTVKDIVDTTVNQNKLTSVTHTVTVGDKEFTGVNRVEFDSGNNALYVVYNEDVDNSAIDINSYRLKDVDNGNTVRKLSGDASFFGNSKTVRITLSDTEKGYITAGTDTLLISGVKDVAGNGISGFQLEELIETIGSVQAGVVANGIKAVSKDKITVQFDQDLQSVKKEDFDLSLDNGVNWTKKPVAIGTELTSDGTLVTLTFDVDLPTDLDDVKIKATFSNDTVNQFGVKPSNIASVSPADGVAPELVADASNPIQTLDTNGDGKIDHVLLTFTEAIKAGTVSTDKFTVDGYTIVDAYSTTSTTGATEVARATTAAVDGEYVLLRVKQKDSVDSDATPRVTVSATITDVAGNEFAGITTAKASVDKAAPVVTSAVKDSTTKVTINFSEALDADTVILDNFAGTADIDAVELSDDGKSVVVTLGTALAGVETIIVKADVKDANGNAITAKTLTHGTDF